MGDGSIRPAVATPATGRDEAGWSAPSSSTRRRSRGRVLLAAALALTAGLVALAVLLPARDDSDVAIATVRQHLTHGKGEAPTSIGCSADGPSNAATSQWRCTASVPGVAGGKEFVVVVDHGTGRIVTN